MKTTRFQIAEYWASADGHKHWPEARWKVCLDEPACFACRWHNQQWDQAGAPERCWESAKGLERAHVIAAAEGGADLSGNLVLLCGLCHEEAPMTIEPEVMFRWLDARPSHETRRINEVVAELARLGIKDPPLLALAIEGALDRAMHELQLGLHFTGFGPRISPGTWAAVIQRALVLR